MSYMRGHSSFITSLLLIKKMLCIRETAQFSVLNPLIGPKMLKKRRHSKREDEYASSNFFTLEKFIDTSTHKANYLILECGFCWFIVKENICSFLRKYLSFI